MRMFATPEGDAGFALKGDDIVSVFKHPKAPYRNVTRSMLDLATHQGGRRLDAFDTVLPHIYGQNGFRTVARTPFNDQYKPDGWDYDTFKKHNGGRPDVVFMVHDPQAGAYQPWDGKRIEDYDEGEVHQRAALAEIDRRGNVPAQPGPESYGSGQLIRMAPGSTPTTVWHGTPHQFPPTRANPLGEFDMTKMGTGEGAQVIAHGPYVAGNDAVAKRYRDDLAGGVTYRGGHWMGLSDPEHTAVDRVASHMRDHHVTPEQAIEAVRDQHARAAASWQRNRLPGVDTPASQANQKNAEYNQHIADAVQRLRPQDFAHDPGSLYEAQLHIHPDHMLDWDKLHSEQSPYVQERLRAAGLHPEGANWRGHEIHTAASKGGVAYVQPDKAVAARALLNAGIPGVRYLDQGSRNPASVQILSPEETTHGQWLVKQIPNGQVHYRGPDEAAARAAFAQHQVKQTHNYVVFDPRTMHIVRRNGLPAMVEAGADALRDHKKGGA